MKPAAVILTVLCLAALAGTGVLYMSSNIIVEETLCTAYAASDQLQTFQTLKSQLASGAFTGTPFDVSSIGEADHYQFYEYTVLLRNHSFLKAEIIEIQVTPMNGDVLQISDLEAHDLAPGASGSFTATILTTLGMHNIRELTLSYYLWGLPFSTRITFSG